MNNSDFLAHAVKKFDVKSSIQTFDAEKSKSKPSSDPDGDGSSEKKKPQKIYRRGKLISTSKDSASTESSKTYRDRASERKNQDSSEYASTYEMLKGFSGSAEMSQYLGGSEEFTHLVKGLDKRLAAKERDTINDKPNLSNENLNANITSLVRRHINSDVTAISSVIKYLKGKLFVNTGEKNTKVRKEIYQFNLENEGVRKIRLGGVSGGEREGVRVGEDVIKIIEAGRVKGLKIQKERKEVKMRKERIKELERKAKEEESEDDIFKDEGEYVPEEGGGGGGGGGIVGGIFEEEEEEEAIEGGGKLVLPTFHSGVDVEEDKHKDILGGKKVKKREREMDGTFGGNDYGEDVDVDFENDEGAENWNDYVDGEEEGEGEGGEGEKKKGKNKKKRRKKSDA